MAVVNRQWVVAARPDGPPRPDDFEYRETAMPQPADGEVLLETLYLSLAPVMAMYMSGAPIAGRPPLEIGDVIHGRGVGRVIESRHKDCQPGDILHGQFGWQSHKVTNLPEADRFYLFTATDLPAHLALGPLGMTGFSAYCGFVDVGEPQPGKPVLVSGAAGGVGHLVVQIARCLGCSPVVGIAGGPEKCAFLLEELGCDHALDYRAGPLDDDLARLFPDGVDLYFDNVGGEMLESVLERLGDRARVVLCGLMAQYNIDEMPPGPNPAWIIKARATVRGMVVYDHEDLRPTFVQDVSGWLNEGRIQYLEDRTEGLEHAPEAFSRLMRGENVGKSIVVVSAE